MNMQGRLTLVTGAGSGIGRAAALRLARAGADVALLSRTREELAEVAAEIEQMGRKALVLVADTSSEAQMQQAFDTITKEFGRLDFVFANAGVNGTWAPLGDLS